MAKQLRNDPDRRMTNVAIQAGVGSFPEEDFDRLDPSMLSGWIADLRLAETSTRALRHRLETLVAGPGRTCAVCGGVVAGKASKVYCGTTCRQRARRSRTAG